MVTRDEIKSLYSYDPDTGVFRFLNTGPGRRGIAGTVNKRKHSNYACLSVNYRKVYAHRAAWICVYGDIPNSLVIDHIDGNGLNNRICNLRVVTKSANQRNRRNILKQNSISGVYTHRGGYSVHFLGKHRSWVKDYFEACCIRKGLEASNGFINEVMA